MDKIWSQYRYKRLQVVDRILPFQTWNFFEFANLALMLDSNIISAYQSGLLWPISPFRMKYDRWWRLAKAAVRPLPMVRIVPLKHFSLVVPQRYDTDHWADPGAMRVNQLRRRTCTLLEYVSTTVFSCPQAHAEVKSLIIHSLYM